MPGVFQKLNLKLETEILVIGAPDSFQPELATLQGIQVLHRLDEAAAVAFALVFVTRQADVDRVCKALAPKAVADAVIWFAYPKGTSKRLRCDFNRDTGWDVLRGLGWDTVRAVAIDEDWSALRFRRKEFIQRRA